MELDINLKFMAIQNKTVDIIDAFSTDPRISQLNLRVLKDDKRYFPIYQAGIVVRKKTLEKHPEMKELLGKLEDSINDSTMIMLNYQVDILHKSTEKVAEDFLKSKGMIK